MAIFNFDGELDNDVNEPAKVIRKALEAINDLDERVRKLEEGAAK